MIIQSGSSIKIIVVKSQTIFLSEMVQLILILSTGLCIYKQRGNNMTIVLHQGTAQTTKVHIPRLNLCVQTVFKLKARWMCV